MSDENQPSVRIVGTEQPVSPLRRVLPVVLTLLTVGLVIAVALLALEVRKQDQQAERRASAVRVAQQQALGLLGISDSNVNDRIKELLDHSTGDFRKQLQGIRNSFGQVVKEGEVRSTGKVDLAAVVADSETKARVILALSSTVENKSTKKPEPRIYRIGVDLAWVEDEWLVAGMEFAP